ncbi:MAG: hypothetical protein QW424_03070 [Candidatus Bathyarchaeia archaeon]
MLVLRELLRKLFGKPVKKEERQDCVEGLNCVADIEEKVLEELLQEDKAFFDVLKKTKSLEVYLNNWRFYFRLLQYQYINFLETRRRERGLVDSYIS